MSEDFIGPLLGVIVGGVITTIGTVSVERRPEKREEKREARVEAQAIRQAARLIHRERVEIHNDLTISIEQNGWWDRPPGRRSLLAPLLRDGVVGVGVAQMIEYVLQRGNSDFLKQGGVAIRRAWRCAAALGQARPWRLLFGRDHARNWDALSELLRAGPPDRPKSQQR